MKNKTYLISGICVASVVFCLPLAAQTMPRTHSSPAASPHTTASPIPSPGKQTTRPFPFHGMISAVDQNAKTFTIAGKKTSRVFKITDKTTITKGGNTAGIQDITENEEASGSYYKDADGSLEAKMVKLGPMSTSEKGKEGAKKRSDSPAPSATASPGAQ